MAQCLCHGIPYHTEYLLAVLETQFHLSRVDIDIQKFRFDFKMQHGERIFVLHHKRLISLLDGLIDDIAFDVSSINIVVFKIPVASGDRRLPNKAFYAERFPSHGNREQICCDLPAIHRVDDVL